MLAGELHARCFSAIWGIDLHLGLLIADTPAGSNPNNRYLKSLKKKLCY